MRDQPRQPREQRPFACLRRACLECVVETSLRVHLRSLSASRAVYESPDVHAIRRRTQEQLASFHDGVKRFLNPHRYPVGLDAGLLDLRTRLVLEARGLKA